MGNRYLNAEATAEYLGFGTGKKGADIIRQMVHRRQIEHIKIGTRLRFDVRALDVWMEKRRVLAQESA